jgi:class 3 adenylate cyclase/tetratricopeptide (TPR) repeat protein
MDERRIVTALFCDIVGSTAIAEQLDPEDWGEIVSGAFPLLIDPVERYGGKVTRLLGDAILAIFGAQQTHEDDPQRAILSGLMIIDELQPYREKVRRVFGIDFNVRIGINTGLVVVGEFGGGGATEYTAMGDAINVAARMQQAAEPGTVLVTQNTYDVAARFFEFDPRGPLSVKGKSEQLAAYTAVTARSEPIPLHHGIGRPSLMVGRDGELKTLIDALDVEVTEGLRLVAIVGEAGLGKTRLLQEAKRVWFEGSDEESRPARSWLEDRSPPFETAQPYSIFSEGFRRALAMNNEPASDFIPTRTTCSDVLKGPTPAERERVEALIRVLNERGDSTKVAGIVVDAENLRREIVQLSVNLWRTWTETYGPSVYVMEDFHGLDPASIELIGPLLDGLIDLPIIVLITMRPEQSSPAWPTYLSFATREDTRYQTLVLQPLNGNQSEALVSELVGTTALPDSDRAAILDRAEGNPLYLEELIRSLGETGEFVAGPGDAARGNTKAFTRSTLPGSLQGLLQARIDRLDRSARQTLQHAAVIGRSFDRWLLAALADNPAETTRNLTRLEAAGLIQATDDRLRFRHALIWEAVITGLLKRQRQKLHRRVGEALELGASELTTDILGRLSYHFHAARDRRAIEYGGMAGDQALAIFASAEAVEHYRRAIEISELHEETEALHHLYTSRGRAFEISGNFDRALSDHNTALTISKDRGESKHEWESLLSLGMLWAERDYTRTGDFFQQAHDLARDTGDDLLVARSLNRLGNWHANAGKPAESLPLHHQALEIYREHADREGLAGTLDLIGMLHTISGNAVAANESISQAARLFRELENLPGLSSSLITLSLRSATLLTDIVVNPEDPLAVAQRDVEEALELVRTIGWRSGEARSLWALASVLGGRGLYDQALDAAQTSRDIATTVEHLQWMAASQCVLGAIYVDLLAWRRALAYLEPALDLAARTGSSHWIRVATGLTARALTGAGEFDHADQFLEEISPANANIRIMAQTFVSCARAEVLLARNQPDKAFAIVSEAIASAPGANQNPIIRLAYLQGLALLALGQPDRASAELGAAIRVAEHQGAAGLTWRLHAAWATAAEMCGDEHSAQQSRSTASTIVARLAGDVSDAEVRSQFLAHAEAMINDSNR